jgi:hypothetical protein
LLPLYCLCCSGKTSLCKALAGRLPSNRVWGDISVLVSTNGNSTNSCNTPVTSKATDTLASSVKSNAAKDTAAAAFAVGNGGGLLPAAAVAHITGFVPQFDLLHESLTVSVVVCLVCYYVM